MRVAIGGLLLILGCTADDETLAHDDARYGCKPGDAMLEDATCQPPGVPPDRCGSGFEPDGGGGCIAILPPPCPAGLMAVPGETACREVAPCGGSRWGEAPTDSATQHVDQAYAGNVSDGSEARPWRTVGEAIAIAAPGAVVAIAAGTYAEDVSTAAKPVRLWGRCPGLVTLVGSAVRNEVVLVRTGADGTELHDLALRGPHLGVALSGSEGVLVDRVWFHDLGYAGFEAVDILGATSATVRRSLIELAVGVGIHVGGAAVTVEESVVRDTLLGDPMVQPPRPFSGYGISLEIGPAGGAAAELTVRASVVERSHGMGINMLGSNALVETSVVRDSQPQADLQFGRGFSVEQHPNTAAPSSLVLHASVVERNIESGVCVFSSSAVIEDSVIRDTQVQALYGIFGDGVTATPDPATTGAPPSLEIRRSLVQGNHEVGIGVLGGTALVESVAVRDTSPNGLDKTGFGIGVGYPGLTASATVRSSVVERSFELGIAAFGAELLVEGSAVRDTRARAEDGFFGDGVAAVFVDVPASITVTASEIAGSAHAGIDDFGSLVQLATSRLECNVLDFAVQDQTSTLVDSGGNRCGCGDEQHECQAIAVTLLPPTPPDPPSGGP